ncbi:MAG: aminomethyl-transferring glycine dehydrogenase subunit GcvPA [Polyangiaceae bacterium]
MRYLPHTEDEIRDMLAAIGAPSIDALFDPIPKDARLGRALGIEKGLDEPRLMAHMQGLAAKNTAVTATSFLGAGIYDHHVPPAVDQLLLRGEFYTAYTPYQPEVAQGTLAAIFEFQTIVAELFGMPVANASMYDGASAAAEAALMARRLTKRTHVLVSGGVHPEYVETMRTYVRNLPGGSGEIEVVPVAADGSDDLSALRGKLRDDTAAVLVGYPNFFGAVTDLRPIADAAHEKGALLVTATAEPYALALLESPGAQGADIAVGEGQPIGIGAQYGGPGCGLFACRDTREFMQNIPGRLCGETVDKNGQRGYVLTLSTREQHIRRDRATSNICTNHSLIALAITIRMCLLGKSGFVSVAKHCLSKAEYLKAEIAKTGSFEIPHGAKTFNEFVVRSKKSPAESVLAKLANRGILGGVALSRFADPALAARKDDFLVAVTERHEKTDLDAFVAALRAAV